MRGKIFRKLLLYKRNQFDKKNIFNLYKQKLKQWK